MGFRKRFTSLTLVALAVGVLTGCTTQQAAPDYVPTPKTAVYGTGQQVNAAVGRQVTVRQRVVGAVLQRVGTFDTAAHQQSLTYDNVSAVSYDLGANSPVFINGNRTTKACDAGKTLGPDIGEGFYVVGDGFLLPASGHTLTLASTTKNVAAALKSVAAGAVQTTAATADKPVTVYGFKAKGGQMMRVSVYSSGSTVTGIQVSLVLAADTCYKLNTLPLTSPEIVKAWRAQVKVLQNT